MASEKWPVSEQGDVAKALSDAILVVCNHARRISRDKGKLAEACKNLTSFQVEKLEAIRNLVDQRKEETKDEQKPGAKSPANQRRGNHIARQLAPLRYTLFGGRLVVYYVPLPSTTYKNE